MITLDTVLAAVEALGPPLPRRWLVRRAGLPAEHDALLDSLGLPERADSDGRPLPSHYMPPSAVGLIFTEWPDRFDPLGARLFVTILTAANVAPAEPPAARS